MSNVNFNFTVGPQEAETIAEIMNDALADIILKKVDAHVDGKQAEVEWFEKHIAYLKRLQKIVVESITKVD